MSALSRKRDAAAEEAAVWLLRLEQDRSQECRSEFIQWFKQSDLHMEQFLVVSAIRRRLRTFHVQEERAQTAPSVSESFWDRLRKMPVWLRFAGLGIAAGLVTILFRLPVHLVPEMTTVSLVSPADPTRVTSLPDGSRIQLNTGGRAEMVTSRESRELRLYAGEVRVSVYHDTSRPFRLVNGIFVINDIGTQFIASPHGSGIRVLVLDGSVRLTAKCHPSRPGSLEETREMSIARTQEVIVSDDRCATKSIPRNLTEREINGKIAWTLRYHFDNDRLVDAADRFNRYNVLQLKVDSLVAERRVTGDFRLSDPVGFARNIERLGGVRIMNGAANEPHPKEIYLVNSDSNSDSQN